MGSSEAKEDPTVEKYLLSMFLKTVPNLLQNVVENKKDFFEFYNDTWLPQRKSTLSVLRDTKDLLLKRSLWFRETKWLKRGSILVRMLALLFILFCSQLVLFLMVCVVTTVEVICFKLSDRISRMKQNEQVLIHVLSIDQKNSLQLEKRLTELRNSFDKLKEEVVSFVAENHHGSFDKVTNIPGFEHFRDAVRNVKIDDRKGVTTFFTHFDNLVKVSSKGRERRDTEDAVRNFMASLSLYYSKIAFTDIAKLTFEMLISDADEYVTKMCKTEKCLSDDEAKLGDTVGHLLE